MGTYFCSSTYPIIDFELPIGSSLVAILVYTKGIWFWAKFRISSLNLFNVSVRKFVPLSSCGFLDMGYVMSVICFRTNVH